MAATSAHTKKLVVSASKSNLNSDGEAQSSLADKAENKSVFSRRQKIGIGIFIGCAAAVGLTLLFACPPAGVVAAALVAAKVMGPAIMVAAHAAIPAISGAASVAAAIVTNKLVIGMAAAGAGLAAIAYSRKKKAEQGQKDENEPLSAGKVAGKSVELVGSILDTALTVAFKVACAGVKGLTGLVQYAMKEQEADQKSKNAPEKKQAQGQRNATSRFDGKETGKAPTMLGAAANAAQNAAVSLGSAAVKNVQKAVESFGSAAAETVRNFSK